MSTTSTRNPYDSEAHKPSRNRWLPAVGVLAALALFGAACGADDDAAAAVEPSTDEAQLGERGLPSLDEDDSNADSDSDATSDDEGDGTQVPTDATEQQAIDAFIACMEDEGVDVDAVEAASEQGTEAALTSSPEFLAAEAVCAPILENAFGNFDLDPETEAALADRSADLAACGRQILDIEIPDDILFLDENDPRMQAIEAYETTPEQDAAIEACFEEHLGDIIDDDGNLVQPDEIEES